MNNTDKIILVSGATGLQGGSAARHLMASGWKVRALTRDVNKPAAKTLAEKGAEVVQGDLADRASLDKVLDGAYGVFSVQQFWEHGYDGEIQQGKILADAAKDAGAEHFVYSSVGSAHRQTGLPHFESKWVIEEYIRSGDLKATIFRPVFFMENFFAPDWHDNIYKGTLAMSLKPDRPLQMIAADDIGVFVALAFDKPDEYAGKAIDLAGDDLTGPEMAQAFSRAIEIQVNFMEFPIEQLRSINEEYAIMFEWFNEVGYDVDIRALRDIHPQLKTLDMWLKESGWKKE